MTTPDRVKRVKKPRVPLSDRDLEHLARIHGETSVPVLAKRTGLPYMLVYNVVHGRVKSLSDRHYRMLFGEPPPHRRIDKVDGGLFRRMARLWLFLNDDLTQSDLYREFYGTAHPRKPDLRIFSGRIQMVDAGLERFMRRKFAAAGIDEPLLDQWLAELEELPRRDRVPYGRLKPVLDYLHSRLGIHPTAVLNQTVERYESGALKSVSRDIYDRARGLKRSAEKALGANDAGQIERLKESISGGKTGYTLYLDIREELRFLRMYTKNSARSYLGRSVWTYETGRAKRVADWRARKIMRDCDRFIRERPDLPLAVLPHRWRRRWVHALIDAMMGRIAQLLSRQEGMVFEKRILAPSHARGEYANRFHGFTRFDMAPGVLGMRRKAFDLMVARHCDIFRTVGTYAKRWYLSDLYLKELSRKEYFNLISAKYEILARKSNLPGAGNACMH
ncbi:MAG TPA: hypothetical protein VLT88_11355 [Desulfosarcina sp.]|nr:hypothetical protein [Desulfosarcina sp.]